MEIYRILMILDYGPSSTTTAQNRQAVNHDQKTLGYLRSTQAAGRKKFDVEIIGELVEYRSQTTNNDSEFRFSINDLRE